MYKFRLHFLKCLAVPIFGLVSFSAFIPPAGTFNQRPSLSTKCKQLLLLICVAAFTVPLSGQTLLKAWDFDGFDGDEGPTLATFNATGIGSTTGDVRRAAGIIPFPAGGFDNAFISRDFDNTTLAGARSALEYVKISIRPKAGFGLQLTQLTIQIGRQSNGPNEFALFTNAGGDNFTTQIGSHTSTIKGTSNYETVTFDLTASGLFDNCTTSSDAISFRLYGYGSSVDPSADFNRFWFGNGLVDGTNDIEISGYAEPIPTAPAADQASVSYCVPESSTGARQLRTQAPAGANESVVWILTDAPTGSQFDGSEPLEFMSGEVNNEFRITGGSKGEKLTMRGVANGNSPAVYGTWSFDVKTVNTATDCESTPASGYTATALENPDVTINKFMQMPFNEVCVGTEARFLASPSITGTPGIQTYSWTFSGSPSIVQYGQTADDGVTKRNQGATWASSGAETVDLTVTYDNGCSATAPTHNVTVKALPAAPKEASKTIEFCEGAPNADRLLRLTTPNPISGDQVVVWVLQSAPAGVTLAEYNPPCSATSSLTSPDGYFFLSGTNDNSIRLEPTAPVGDYVFKAKVLDCATDCTSPLSAATYTISKFANPSDAFRPAGTNVTFPFTETLDFDSDHDACPGDVFEYGTEANTAGMNTVSWTLSGGGTILDGQNDRNIQIEWTTPGTYTLEFLVTNNTTGCTATNSLQVTVNEAPAVTIKSFGGNPFDELCPSEQGIYLASASSAGPPMVANYNWTFSSNSSSPATEPGAGTSGTGQLANDGTPRRIGAAWPAPGAESVNLDVTYANGCSVSAPQLDVTVNTPPSDQFRPAGTDVVFPFSETLDFDSDHDACPGDVFEYGTEANTAGMNTVSWTLSGGGTILDGQNDRNIQIEWTTPGTYTLEFLVTNNTTGCTATNSLQVTVNEAPAVTIKSFGGNPFDELCPSEQGIYLASASSAGPPMVANYNWTFSSNSSSPATEPGAGTSGTGQLANDGTPRRIGAAWPAPGAESVNLDVTYANGCSVSAPQLDVTVNTPPSDQFRPAGTDVVFPFSETLDFDSDHDACPGDVFEYGTEANTASINTVSWTLSGGGTILAGQNARNIQIEWTTPGTYTLEFLVTNNTTGCTATNSLQVTVNPLPAANDAMLMACEDNAGTGTATFDLSSIESTVTGGAAGVSVSWFADAGLSSAIGTPSAYVSGTATVYAKVTDGTTACMDVAEVALKVKVQPQIGFNFTNPTGFGGEICNESTVDVGLELDPANASLTEGTDYEFVLDNISYSTDGGSTFNPGYGPVNGSFSVSPFGKVDAVINGAAGVNDMLENTSDSPVVIRYNFFTRSLSGETCDGPFRGFTTVVRPELKLAFDFTNPSNFNGEICNGGTVDIDLDALPAQAALYNEGSDYEIRTVIVRHKIGAGGTSTDGYGPISGGTLTPGGVISGINESLSHTEAEPVFVQYNLVLEDLACGTLDFRSVVVEVRPELKLAFDFTNPSNFNGEICNGGTVDIDLDALPAQAALYNEGSDYEIRTVIVRHKIGAGGTSTDGYGPISGGTLTPGGVISGINESLSHTEAEPVFVQYNLVLEDLACGTLDFRSVVIQVLPAPAITCPADITVQTSNNGTGDCTAEASWTNPTEENGACGPITLTISINGSTPQPVTQGDTYTTTLDKGTYTVTYEVTDGNNNMDQCSFTVEVEDDEKPSSIALPDMTFTTADDGATCPGAADTDLAVDQSNPVATAADNWSFTVHGVTVPGPSGMTDNCSDQDEIEIFVWDINEISTDECESSFKVFFRYFDECGNFRQRGQTFTIIDNTRPSSIALPDMTFTTADDGATCPGAADTDLAVDQSNPVATAADNWSFTVHGVTVPGPSGMTDNCSDQDEIEIFVWDINEISTDECESSFKVFFRYFDECGNFRQRGQTFTIIDNTKPDFTAPDNTTIYADANCDFDASPAVTGDVTDEADNCTNSLEATYSDQVVDGDCEGEKVITRTWSLVDDCGNQAADQIQVITVEDNTAPTLACEDNTVFLNPDGVYTLNDDDVLDLANTFDNCSEVTVTDITPASFDCNFVDKSYDVEVTAEDDCGNTATCTAEIKVEEGTALPDSWDSEDIGNVTLGNEYSYSPCSDEFTVTGSGNNAVGGTTDNVAFAFQELCGDGMITAKVESITPNGYGGLMIRETTAAGSKQVSIFSNLTNVLRHEARYTTNGTKQVQAHYRPYPIWLRLQRMGNWVFAYYSTTGATYQYVHAVQVPMNNCVQIGLASFTYLPNAQTEAVFSNVSVSGSAALAGSGVPDFAQPETEQVRLQAELFPNPTSDVFTMAFPEALPGGATATLRNQIGQVVEQRQLKPGDVTTEWNISELPAGLYLMEVRQEGLNPQVLRVVKAE